MMPTPGQPDKYYGIGAVNYHTGETVVLFQLHQRRREIAELLQTLVDKHPTGIIYVAWDNASMHEDDEGRQWYEQRQAAWSCSTCPPTVPG